MNDRFIIIVIGLNGVSAKVEEGNLVSEHEHSKLNVNTVCREGD